MRASISKPGVTGREYMMKLFLATNNQGKIREYRRLLADLPLELLTPSDMGITREVEETGTTFTENARLKAVAFAEESGLPTLADDSGLEVDALGGEPGIRSARYAGDGASDADRTALVLEKMKDVPMEKRTARFRCVIAYARPNGVVKYGDGVCQGIIATAPSGQNGFGYDPIFYLPELGRTMAELSPEEKNCVSHRGEAAGKIHALLTAELAG